MSTLTVWKFPTANGAEDAVLKLRELQGQRLVQVHDGAIVSWQEGKKKPHTHQLTDMAGRGALGGAFWGFLFGLLFFIPLVGLAIGAASGAIAGSLSGAGIDEGFVNSVRERITPGTSALFVLTSDAVLDRVAEAFEGTTAELIQTNLSDEQEQSLREAFADELQEPQQA